MARPSYPSDDVEKLLLRFPPGMRDRIKVEAKANGRSMNAEVVQRLQEAYESLDYQRSRSSVPDWTDEEIEEMQNSPLRSAPIRIQNQLDEISEQQKQLAENFRMIVDAIEKSRSGTSDEKERGDD